MCTPRILALPCDDPDPHHNFSGVFLIAGLCLQVKQASRTSASAGPGTPTGDENSEGDDHFFDESDFNEGDFMVPVGGSHAESLEPAAPVHREGAGGVGVLGGKGEYVAAALV